MLHRSPSPLGQNDAKAFIYYWKSHNYYGDYHPFFASCDLLTGLLDLANTTTTTTTPTTVANTTHTNFKPVISLFTAAEGKNTKVVTSSTFTFSEYNFALGCPTLAGFTDSGTTLGEGSTFQISYLGVTVTFTVNYFEDGTADRIVKGVRYTGRSADNSSIDLLIEYDPVSKAFYYEQKLFIDDPTGLVFGRTNAKSLISYKMQGSIASDDSIIVYPQGIAFNVIPEYATILVCYREMEYYAGAWDSPFTKNGAGVVFKDVNGKLYADLLL